MLIKVTVEVEGSEVGIVQRELSGTAAEIEEQVKVALQQTGRILLEPAFQEVAEHTRAPVCCGHTMRNCGFRPITVSTTCGIVNVSRRRYRCAQCDREFFPVDASICCGRHRITQPLAKRVCQLATMEHFPRMPDLIAAQHGVTLAHDTILELVHDVGTAIDGRRMAEARRSIQRRVPPSAEQAAPARIYVSCDGIMYCTNLTEPHPDDPARSRLSWHQMKVGCVYWQDANERWHKQMIWGRESPEEFGASLWRLACQCGYREAGEKIFAADGGSWCWEIHARYFSDATGILDWYHASEHIWAAAKIITADTKAWASSALGQMHDGGGTALLTWLKLQLPHSRGKRRAALDDLINYVATKVNLMQYPEYRSHDWQIGTGMMESTCKQLVGQRLKGPGMHWSDQGALAITALRAVHFNGKWNSYWNTLALSI